jgi:glycerophosphoryl diester phosphodiesterase
MIACAAPTVVAHRGASADAPENTIVAYEEAIRQGAEVAECDVHLAADGVVVVIHDETLDRTTDGRGRVEDTKSAHILALDAGAWKDDRFAGERVPALAALLDAVGGRLHLLVEVKEGAGIVDRIAELVEARPRGKGITLISFDGAQVAAAAARMPKVRRLLLREHPAGGFDPEDLVERARAVRADGLGLEARGVDALVVEALHAADLLVFVWTVNDVAQMDVLLAAGVDGLITDHPALGIERVDALRRVGKAP